MRRIVLAVSLIAAAALAAGAGARAQGRLPIFDCHVHYGQNDWGPYPASKVLDLFAAAGVARVLASSTPDDGTLMLHKAAPERVAPVLRPYRAGVGSSNWFNDPNLIEYLEGRLKAGVYKGIGEFHLFDATNAGTKQVKRVTELAVERGIHLHVHSGAAPIEALFKIEPRLKILWAHAGMSEPPEMVGPMLDRYANLSTELSFRAGDVAPGGKLDQRWRALFEKHPGRFMIGTDTYITPRWGDYVGLVEAHRAYLTQLPRDLAERIAFRNAVGLFGGGELKELN
ncbi:MAG: amidohydrolase family protein [Rhodospirillales bacterium]